MSNRTVIAVINEKGGTAKTTTSVNISAALGHLGQKVLLVDLDGQAASSRWLGVEEDHRLADALCRGKGLEPISNLLPNVSLVPASGKLDSVSHDLRPTQGGQLRKLLMDLDGYDFTIIDCPPSLANRLIANGLLAATHVLVPVETSILALDGLKILLTTLEDVRDGFGHELILAGVLACRFDGRTRLSRLVLQELQRALPGKVFQTVIRENVRMRECPASGQSILTFAPESTGAQDYIALANELLAQPQTWRLAAVPASEGGQAFSVESLRDNAAASVRESVRKNSPARPGDDAEVPPAQTAAPWQENAEIATEATVTETHVAQPPSASGGALLLAASGSERLVPSESHAWPEQTGNGTQDYMAQPPSAVQADSDQKAVAPAATIETAPADDMLATQALDSWLKNLEDAQRSLESHDDQPIAEATPVEQELPAVDIPPAPQAMEEIPQFDVSEPEMPVEPSPVAAEPAQPAPPPVRFVCETMDPFGQKSQPLSWQEAVALGETPSEPCIEKAQGDPVESPLDEPPLWAPSGNQAPPQPSDTPSEEEKYAALRAYLQKMQEQGKLPDAPPPGGEPDRNKRPGGFRSLFQKVVGK